MQLSPKNKDLEFMIDYDKRETITLGELMPNWWGEERMAAGIEDLDQSQVKISEVEDAR